ncbi:MAG: helix-turn-helix domain-containing protein, partial [Candidatus Nomurabacteria bacterium]|nr:helix-turn-helix domain-containing protein [Candidatus Nomurabacteria bacterium]
MEENYREKIGKLISELRVNHNLTQAELASKLNTSQSAINRIERGAQNISLEIIARISDVLNSEILSVNDEGKINLRIHGGRKLRGKIAVNTSKNAAMGLLCASLLNKGKTTLRQVPRIEEVNRIIEVLNSIGVKTRWLNDEKDLEIVPPKRLKLAEMDVAAAKRTRTVLMFLGPLLHQFREFKIPFSGGCNLGKRTVEPHLQALAPFGLRVDAACGTDYYSARVIPKKPTSTIVLTERGNTTSENLLMAAALNDGVTVARNLSNDYMVLDVCYYLQKLGVKIDGVGGTNLKITGLPAIDQDVEYFLSEDPIEAMSLIAAAIVTNSEITVERVPIEEIDVELAVLKSMGLKYEISEPYLARNERTVLADILVKKSQL